MQKNYLILAFALILSFASVAKAASPTPSPTPTASSSNLNQVTENIKKRLQNSLSGTEETSTGAVTLRSYVGTIRDVIKETIVIEDKDGKKNVVVTDDTVILRSPGNAPIKIDDVRIDDSIIAIGDSQTPDELSGRRLIVSATPLAESTKLRGLGVISKLGKSTITLTTASETVELITNAKTIIKSTASTTLDVTDLSVGDTIIFTATQDEDDKTATGIMRIKTTSASPTP
jgi:hypothetical protein